MGGRAILVDPPTDSTDYLHARGIAPKTIDGVILTHCHADHDAGTFQKLLEEAQISLYTTPHILGSFLRKYSALSGLSEDLLRRTFSFHPVRIGAPVHVRGGELWFSYTLHSIPTIGFDAFYGNRSISISGDTLYDPERVTDDVREGHPRARTLRGPHRLPRAPQRDPPRGRHPAAPHAHDGARRAPGRREEAALPRPHRREGRARPTPGSARRARASSTRSASSRRARRASARRSSCSTIFSMVDFLRDLPLSRARSLLQVARRMTLPAGEHIVTQGTKGDSFYIIVNGTVQVVKDGVPIKRYRAGDYFGEMAILLDQPRQADVDREDGRRSRRARPQRFPRRAPRQRDARAARAARPRPRRRGVGAARAELGARATSRAPQKTQLQTYLVPCSAHDNEVLWRVGDIPKRAYLVDDAIVTLRCPEGELKPFTAARSSARSMRSALRRSGAELGARHADGRSSSRSSSPISCASSRTTRACTCRSSARASWSDSALDAEPRDDGREPFVERDPRRPAELRLRARRCRRTSRRRRRAGRPRGGRSGDTPRRLAHRCDELGQRDRARPSRGCRRGSPPARDRRQRGCRGRCRRRA